MKKIIIAFDGYSSTGKSTIAKLVANQLHYIYIDTGAMYRAVTLIALRNNLIGATFNEDKLLEILNKTTISFVFSPEKGFAPIYIDGKEEEDAIRSMEVASLVSEIAKNETIRSYLVQKQQEFGINKGIVMDGRDIGTVVFPQAELKIFLIADENIRAQRRYKELTSKNHHITLEEVHQNIKDRDYQDTHRKISPLKRASDAVEIDNSHTSINEVVQKVVEMAKNIICEI